MKKILSLLCCLLAVLVMQAQTVSFQFSSDSYVEARLRPVMQRNASELLSEIHAACKARRPLNLSNISMEKAAKEHLTSLWKVTRFELEEESVVTDCVRDVEGYQARDILVNLHPVDKVTFRGQLARSLTLSFNKRGVITGARFALPLHNIKQIMGEGDAVTDLAERRMLLKFVEDFLGYYNERNIEALRKVYSDDALIITGSVVKKRVRNGDVTSVKTEIRYNQQTKDKYIESLKGIFNRNKEAFHVEFDKIEVVAHATQKGYYGVKVHQKWDTANYHDDGWVFLLWDFRNPDEPMVHVRTWQPYTVAEHEVFSLGDFRLPPSK